MKNFIKQMWLVIVLIAAASFVLLVSDMGQRVRDTKPRAQAYPVITVMQIASTPLLDTHVAGVLSRLEERGFRAANGKNIELFNPQGDFTTANTMARSIADGPSALVITSSTVALQTFAKANLSRRKIHVFGTVTDPYGAGVGIDGPEPGQHPPYMAGIGTFQPVGRSIRLAHEMNPALQRLGVVWNPGEQCSQACLVKARAACGELGIELIEATAVNTSEVSEAARSVLARNADALWVGGDTVAIASISLLIDLSAKAGIPLFSNDPTDAEKGALFGLGADYFTVGRYTADIAADILEGKAPSSFRIENVIPEKLGLNREVLDRFKGQWSLSPSVQELLNAQEERPLTQKALGPAETAIPKPARPLKLRIVLYSETEFAEQCHDGLKDGIRQAGFVEGRDYDLQVYNAQGDISTLSSIMTTIKADHVDLLMPISTPALQAALRQAGSDTRIVFTGVGDGVAAGAGKSLTDHLPNVTGVTTRSDFEGMARIVKETLPGARTVGTLFTPSEINSVLYKDWLKEALEKEGIELLAIPVTASSEVAQGAIDLSRQEIQAVVQISDNLTRPGFALIARKALDRNLPVYVFDSAQMKQGAVLALATDYYDAGLEAAQKAGRVLRGEDPGDIPFSNVQKKKLVLNPELARNCKLKISNEMMKTASIYTKKN